MQIIDGKVISDLNDSGSKESQRAQKQLAKIDKNIMALEASMRSFQAPPKMKMGNFNKAKNMVKKLDDLVEDIGTDIEDVIFKEEGIG